MPDDAALALTNGILGGANTEVLVVPAGLLPPRVEGDEVVNDLQQPLLAAKLQDGAIDRVLDVRRLLPRQVILLLRFNGAVAQALGVIPGHQKLHRRKERTDEFAFLIV